MAVDVILPRPSFTRPCAHGRVPTFLLQSLNQKSVIVDALGIAEPAASGRAIALSSASAGGSVDAKPGSTYADRFVRLIHLMDPRHTMTTEGDVRRYQRLMKDHTAGEVSPRIMFRDRKSERDRAEENQVWHGKQSTV